MGTAVSAREPLFDDKDQPLLLTVAGNLPDSWANYLQRPEARRYIERPRLLQLARGHSGRLTQILGVIGFGRSTLLRQLAEHLNEEGVAAGLILDPRGLDSLAALFSQLGFTVSVTPGKARATRDKKREMEAIAAQIQSRAKQSTNGSYELLIDDIEWCAESEVLNELLDLLLLAPSLRITVVGLEALSVSEKYADAVGNGRRIGMGDLCFTPEETKAITVEYLENFPHKNLLSARRLDTVHRSTMGVPLSVALAMDKMTSGLGDPYDGLFFGATLSAIRIEMERRYPRPPLEYPFMRLLWRLSLMPRFSLRHIAKLSPGITNEDLPQLTLMPTLDHGKAVLPGEFAWADSGWAVLLEWSSFFAEDRLRLADRLEAAGERSPAFEQLLFAGALRKAERVLRGSFLTIYETLSPESLQHLRERTAEELRPHLYLRTMAALSSPYMQEEPLLLCAQSLALVAKRSGTKIEKITALAVRTAVLSRLESHRSQVRILAQELHAEIRDYGAVDRKEEVPLAEARLIGVLAIATSEAYPDLSIFLAKPLGEPHLDRRNAALQVLIDTWRFGPQENPRPGVRYEQTGYRALIYSDQDVFDELDGWRRLDARSVQPIPGVTDMEMAERARVFRSSWASENLPPSLHSIAATASLFVVGNLRDAERQAIALASPASELIRGLIALAQADAQRCLDVLDEVTTNWGERFSVIFALLRAVALRQLGKREAAVHTLNGVKGSVPAILGMGAAVLPVEELGELTALAPWFRPYADVAEAGGLFGSGVSLLSPKYVQPLTKREKEILVGLARGHSTKRIAEDAFLSVNTVKTHVLALSRKLAASGRAEIVQRASDLGMLG